MAFKQISFNLLKDLVFFKGNMEYMKTMDKIDV